VRLVCAVLNESPTVRDVPGLTRYLAALPLHLETVVDAWQGTDSPPVFVMTYDELVRPAGLTLSAFKADLRRMFAIEWQRFAWSIASGATTVLIDSIRSTISSQRVLARVRRDKHFGLIRLDGSLALPLSWSSLEWSDALHCWQATREGRRTLLHAWQLLGRYGLR
jgi:hypothetical protein